ncbi:MAGE family-domain-containing protein [Xylariales sp. PMI_506]|nr:MAGE family-domain-containing protein [Xylariales sp. PMI_506]
MPPQIQRKRRAAQRQDIDEDEPRPRQPRREREPDDSAQESDVDEDGDVDISGTHSADEAQLVKKLVRYALACEYARTPIRRDGIREKVLGNNARLFKRVFDGAQQQLRQVFGMEMVELPVKEKRTLRDKQKASATQRKAASQNAAASRSYILVTILPPAYRDRAILAPSRLPGPVEEAEYVGFYTFVIALIVLSGGELSDAKLQRQLDRVNAAKNLPIDTTQTVLSRLVKQGYLDKVVQRSETGDEDAVTWCVGSRAKVEVPPESIAAFVREVWGNPPEDFDQKLAKSLGLQNLQGHEAEDEDDEEEDE